MLSALFIGDHNSAAKLIYRHITGQELQMKRDSSYNSSIFFVEERDGKPYINGKEVYLDDFDGSSHQSNTFWWDPISTYTLKAVPSNYPVAQTDVEPLLLRYPNTPSPLKGRVTDREYFEYAMAHGVYTTKNPFVSKMDELSDMELLSLTTRALLQYGSRSYLNSITKQTTFMDYLAKRLQAIDVKILADYIIDQAYDAVIRQSLVLLKLLTKYHSEADQREFLQILANHNFFTSYQDISIDDAEVNKINIDSLIHGKKSFNRIQYIVTYTMTQTNEAEIMDIVVKSINKNRSNKKIPNIIEHLKLKGLSTTLLNIDRELLKKIYPEGLVANGVVIVGGEKLPETQFKNFYDTVKQDYTDTRFFSLYSMVNFLPHEQFEKEVHYIANFIEPHVIDGATRYEAKWEMLYNVRIARDENNTLYNKENMLTLAKELGSRFTAASNINKTKLYVYLSTVGIINEYMAVCEDAELLKHLKKVKMEKKLK